MSRGGGTTLYVTGFGQGTRARDLAYEFERYVTTQALSPVLHCTTAHIAHRSLCHPRSARTYTICFVPRLRTGARFFIHTVAFRGSFLIPTRTTSMRMALHSRNTY